MKKIKTAVKPTAAIPAASGIHVADNPRIALRHRQAAGNPLVFILLSFLGVFGMMLSFFSMFPLQYHQGKVIAVLIACWGLFTTLFMLPKRWLLALIPCFGYVEYKIVTGWQDVTDGFMHVYNHIYRCIHCTDTDFYATFFRTGPHAEQDTTTTFLCLSMTLLILLICYITVLHPNAILGFVCTFPLIEIGLYYGLEPNFLSFAMLLTYWVALVTLDHGSGGSHHKQNHFFAKIATKRQVGRQSAVLMAGVTFGLFLTVQFALFVAGYHRTEKLNEMRAALKDRAEMLSFESISDFLSSIPEALGMDTDSGVRKLGQLDEIRYNYKPVLKLSLSDETMTDLYLRGYVGASYTGDGWNTLPDEVVDDNRKLFDQFAENGMFPQDFLGMNMALLSQQPQLTLDIHAESKHEKYNYAPYGVLSAGAYQYITDARLKGQDTRNYPMSFYAQSYTDTAFIPTLHDRYLANRYTVVPMEYINNEQSYAAFVRKNYLDVPDTQEMDEIRSWLGIAPLSAESTAEEIAATISQIQNLLTDTATYTLAPGATPTGEDFIHYFLLSSKKGYCTYFASAGVMLCRMAGIPARYVEGYVSTYEDQNTTNRRNDGTYQITIDDSRGHAWGEVYIDGIGWVPVEFTATASLFYNRNQMSQSTDTPSTQTNQAPAGTTTASKATTTVKVTTVATGTGNGNSGNHSHGGQGLSLSSGSVRVLLTVLGVLLLISITALVFMLRHRRICKRRSNGLDTKNTNAAALAGYEYLLELLRFMGITDKNRIPVFFAAQAEQDCIYLADAQMVKATEIAQEATFSTHSVSQENAAYVTALARQVALQLLADARPLRRLYLRYILNLAE